MATPSLASKLIAEFTGTFLLVFTVGCNVLGKTGVFGGVSIACVLMVAIYALGGISGGNFNPAVSVSLGLMKTLGGGGMDWKEVGLYCVVQVVGGLVAGGLYAFLFWNAFNLQPSAGFGGLQAGLCEILYTFMLCFVVLNVAGAKKNDNTPNQYYGLAIGFVIVAGAYGAGAVSGGCFNPAVAIGIDTSSAGIGFGWCVAYTAFELVGAALAVALFRIVRPEDFSTVEPKQPVSRYASEFLGTFMLVLTVGLNVLGNSPAGAFSIAASLMCMIYALGDVSGAHFNPAVTVAIFCTGRDSELTGGEMCKYMVSQLLGGICAAFTYALIYHGKTFSLGPNPGFGWPEVVIAELIFTFVLSYVVLCVAVSTRTKSTEMFGLAIGSCVTVGGLAIGGISGGSLNPAVSVGIEAAHMLQGGVFYKALIFAAIECIGGAAAAGLFKVTHACEDEEKTPLLAEKEKVSA